jgi:tRNA threonylcarbamoyladenosine biosynthesis protein TsaB
VINNSLILHLETATESCSVAISRNNELVAFAEAVPMAHAAAITLLIQNCLEQINALPRDLSAVSVSKGPGSYTALRVGASVAKGICYALDIPLIAIDTLHSLAMAASAEIGDPNAYYIPMIDARRMEVYTALYDFVGQAIVPLHSRIIDEQTNSEWQALERPLVLTGNGVSKCRDLLHSSNFIYLPKNCSAKYLIKIAYQYFIDRNFVDTTVFSPEYAKQPNITTARKIF